MTAPSGTEPAAADPARRPHWPMADLGQVRAIRTEDGRIWHPSQITLIYDDDPTPPAS